MNSILVNLVQGNIPKLEFGNELKKRKDM